MDYKIESVKKIACSCAIIHPAGVYGKAGHGERSEADADADENRLAATNITMIDYHEYHDEYPCVL